MRSWPASAVNTANKNGAGSAPLGKDRCVRILGIDPGLRHTGWGVIETEGNQLRYVGAGVVEPNARLSMAERLKVLFDEVSSLVVQFSPEECAVEESFVNQNPVSTLKLGHARAAAMLAPATANIPVFEYKPNLVKKSVVGSGHAEKQQVAAMIRVLLPGWRASQEDAADALAVAVCHTHHRATARRVANQRATS